MFRSALIWLLPAMAVAQVNTASSQPTTQQMRAIATAHDAALRAYFAASPEERTKLSRPWERLGPLSAAESVAWRDVIWQAYAAADGPVQRAWKDDLANRRVTLGSRMLRYTARTQGVKPPTGWPLLVSLHPDGGSPAGNDERWHEQGERYEFDGVLVCPRAPMDGPEQWYTAECYGLLDLLVRQFIAFGEVDPNRVYLHGYGAAGAGVLRLGPNLADRWAAVAVAAAAEGPDCAPIENLRSTALLLQVAKGGAQAKLATAWSETMIALKDDRDPNEYVCRLVVRDERQPTGRMEAGSVAVDDRDSPVWLAEQTRSPVPKRIMWTQSGPVQRERYWLRLDDPYSGKPPPPWGNRPETIDARVGGQVITINAKGLPFVRLRLDDRMLNLDEPLTVTVNDEEAFTGAVPRLAETLVKTLTERGDPAFMFPAEMELPVPPPIPERMKLAQVGAAPPPPHAQPSDPALLAAVEAALVKAGVNAPELCRALADVGDERRPGMFYWVAHMPDRDLIALKADFLVENVRLAYEGWKNAPWSAQISEQQFFQYILPSAHFNERRDNWRREFFDRYHAQAWKFRDPIDAAVALSAVLNDDLNVHYHAHLRPKSDQSPSESIAAHYASCSGLSILLANSCRAVGIPARLAGVPRWLDDSGNHTWVEVWGGSPEWQDGAPPRQWYNLGDTVSDPRKGSWVNEATATKTDPDRLLARVYATCFRPSPFYFPLAWDLNIRYIPALNVTRFYKAPVNVEVEVPGGGRGEVTVYWAGEVLLVAAGVDKIRVPLAEGETFRLVITRADGSRVERELKL